jgi:uroporphyrinogen decarboxylase
MSLFLKAISGEKLERFPVWLMRQAGRYQPSYQKIRASRSLVEMFFNPEIIAEVTMLPVRELNVDAAILFSDILVIIRTLGLDVTFPDEGGIVCSKKIASLQDVLSLEKRDVAETLSPIFQAIQLLKPGVPLIGFAGGPFTVASYLCQTKGKEQEGARIFLHRDKNAFSLLIDLLTEQTIEYLQLQIKAGVSCVQIFDSWASSLSNEDFITYSMVPLEKIKKAIGGVPLIYFSRGSSLRSSLITVPDVISFDWLKSLSTLQKETNKIIQGNFDPALLFTSPKEIKRALKETLSYIKPEKTIINLGHGVLPGTPYDNVRAFIETIQAS